MGECGSKIIVLYTSCLSYRYEYSHTTDRLWRKNRAANHDTLGLCRGVDLNRNFGYKWAHEVMDMIV